MDTPPITPAAGHPQNDSVNYERQILDLTPTGTLITRISDGTILFANRTIGDMLGVADVHTIIGTPVPNFYWDPEERKIVVGRFRAEGSLNNYEMRARRSDASMFWVSLSLRPFQFEGETTLLSTIQDITDRKQGEQGLSESEERYRSAITAIDAVSYHIDYRTESYQFIGENIEKLTGYNPKEITPALLGQLIQETITTGKDAGLPRSEAIEKTRAGQKSEWKADYLILDRKGEAHWLRDSSTQVLDAQGKPVGAIGILQDITEHKKAQAAIRSEGERFQTILETVRVPTIISRLSDGIVLYANQALADVSRVHLDKLIGFATGNFYANPDDRKTVLESIRQHGHIEDFEVEFRRTDGSLYWALLSSHIIDYGGERCVLSSYIDITGRKRAADALQRSEEQQKQQSLRLRAVIEAADELLRIPDVDTIYRRAMELAREKLGIERCGMWLIDPTHQYVQGSYGTDAEGHTIDERAVIQPIASHASLALLKDKLWMATEGAPRLYWKDGQQFDDGTGWVVATNLRSSSGQIGIIYNDAAISGAPLDDDLQDSFALFCSMLPSIIERKRLEQQVQTAFERRGRQTQLSTQVSQAIAAATSMEDLYQRVVTQVKEQFDYYHTQILHFDAGQNAVVLVTGYGEIGAKMLADGHRLPMGEGLIGIAAASGETVLRTALENDPDWHPNPLLPDTKGEIAVPIKLGNDILGVLDVQSNAAGALGTDDQLLLEGLCGQIATAIEGTRLNQEMAERLKEINRLYQAMSHEGWQTYRETAEFPTGFMFDQAGTRPVESSGLTGELFAEIPLTVLGGEVIGTLAIADDPEHPFSPDDRTFLQQISEQVALALESARLFEQTQAALSEAARRASELETVARVSATTSTVLDPERLLQAVVDLTKERFGIYHAHIYLLDQDSQTALGEDLRLAAGAGEVGRTMVAEKRTIALHTERSLVAHAARERQAVMVNDVRSNPDFLPNPLLPDTRSEMAVPIIVGDKVLGVFDVQSDRLAGFSKEDAGIYTTLASQVAVALQNARLYVEQAATVTQLRELDRLKSSFLANMSHELRTPLNSILGFADVILEGLDGPLTENMDNDLGLIQKNGQHLLLLINDVLDMAKIEAGMMNLNPERFRITEVLEEVVNIITPLTTGKALSLLIEDNSDHEVQVFADRIRIRQVMINLVNNAMKFTETGQISICATHQDENLLISVRDTGIGIPQEHLETVFQEFLQVDNSTTRKAGGSGLGLAISRRLIEMHGGRMWAESSGVPGEGSTFNIELPIEAKMTKPVAKQEK